MTDPLEYGFDEPTTTTVDTRALGTAVRGPALRVVRSGDKALVGRVVTLGDMTIVGRASDATLVVLDEGISRHHVQIVREESGFRVADLGSRNGTWVNGTPTKEAKLSSGDLIELGRDTALEFTTGATHARLRDALGAAGMATWELNPRTLLIEFSEQADAHLGLPWGAVGGRQRALSSLVHPDDLKRVTQAFADAAASGSRLELEFRLAPQHGPKWLACKGNVVMRGADTWLTGTAAHVSARRLAEEELHRHALIFDLLPDAAFVTTLTGELLDANPAAAKLFALQRESVTGRGLLEVLRAPPRVTIALVTQGVTSAGRYAAELDLETANGALLTCAVTVVAMKRPSRETVGLVWTMRDLSEHKQLVRKLALADRLAALGTLSAGVAHEINNPLSFVEANLKHLRNELATRGGAPELETVIDESLEGTRRITAIVDDLKAFAREGDSAEPVPVDVGRAVQLAHKLAMHSLRHRAKVTLELGPVPPVLAQEHRLSQVALNLLLNAGQAVGERPDATISVRLYSPREREVILEVADSGEGIAPEVLPHIFDPFFTTRGVGGGTGLGLSIVHGIVTSLGGRVDVDSAPGKGARFRVILPTVLADPARTTAELANFPREPSARVLIVDDEPLVVSSLKRHLRGHHVVGSQSAREALALLEQHTFDVVLCDLLMPEMSGMELHRQLRERSPSLATRIVFMTGGAITEQAASFVSEVQATVLRKPVDLDALRRTIAAVAQREADAG